MTEEVVYINDPLERKISMSKNLCNLEIEEIDQLDLYDDLFSVIQKPAFLIETTDSPSEFLYYRSIGWNLSVLIKVRFAGYFWEAYKCMLNPSDGDIVEILKNGKQIL
jgi:hypothetical protein